MTSAEINYGSLRVKPVGGLLGFFLLPGPVLALTDWKYGLDICPGSIWIGLRWWVGNPRVTLGALFLNSEPALALALTTRDAPSSLSCLSCRAPKKLRAAWACPVTFQLFKMEPNGSSLSVSINSGNIMMDNTYQEKTCHIVAHHILDISLSSKPLFLKARTTNHDELASMM